MGCHLVILGCNTASAKALRSIQQNDLPHMDSDRRVLGVIRPTAECIGHITKTRHVGIMATPGTIRSCTYDMEISKLYPDIIVTGEACPMWVPLVENFEFDSPGADYFVEKSINHLLERDSKIDSIILGCTHYPLLQKKILRYTPSNIHLIFQGEYVARSLQDYLFRHPEMDCRLTKNGTIRYLTTDQPEQFSQSANIFMGQPIQASRIVLE